MIERIEKLDGLTLASIKGHHVLEEMMNSLLQECLLLAAAVGRKSEFYHPDPFHGSYRATTMRLPPARLSLTTFDALKHDLKVPPNGLEVASYAGLVLLVRSGVSGRVVSRVARRWPSSRDEMLAQMKDGRALEGERL